MANNSVTFTRSLTADGKPSKRIWTASTATFDLSVNEKVAWDLTDIVEELESDRGAPVDVRFVFWNSVRYLGSDLLLPFGIPTFELSDLRPTSEPLIYEQDAHPLVAQYVEESSPTELKLSYQIFFPAEDDTDVFVIGEDSPPMIIVI